MVTRLLFANFFFLIFFYVFSFWASVIQRCCRRRHLHPSLMCSSSVGGRTRLAGYGSHVMRHIMPPQPTSIPDLANNSRLDNDTTKTKICPAFILASISLYYHYCYYYQVGLYLSFMFFALSQHENSFRIQEIVLIKCHRIYLVAQLQNGDRHREREFFAGEWNAHWNTIRMRHNQFQLPHYFFFRYVIFFFGLFCCCQWLCYFVCALFFSFLPIHLLMLFMLLRFRAMKENGNEKLFGALGVHHLCNWTTDKWNVFYIGRRMAAEWKWRNIIEQWVKSFYCCWECETSESDEK